MNNYMNNYIQPLNWPDDQDYQQIIDTIKTELKTLKIPENIRNLFSVDISQAPSIPPIDTQTEGMTEEQKKIYEDLLKEWKSLRQKLGNLYITRVLCAQSLISEDCFSISERKKTTNIGQKPDTKSITDNDTRLNGQLAVLQNDLEKSGTLLKKMIGEYNLVSANVAELEHKKKGRGLSKEEEEELAAKTNYLTELKSEVANRRNAFEDAKTREEVNFKNIHDKRLKKQEVELNYMTCLCAIATIYAEIRGIETKEINAKEYQSVIGCLYTRYLQLELTRTVVPDLKDQFWLLEKHNQIRGGSAMSQEEKETYERIKEYLSVAALTSRWIDQKYKYRQDLGPDQIKIPISPNELRQLLSTEKTPEEPTVAKGRAS